MGPKPILQVEPIGNDKLKAGMKISNLKVETTCWPTCCFVGFVCSELSLKPIAGITHPRLVCFGPKKSWKVPTICASYPAKLRPRGLKQWKGGASSYPKKPMTLHQVTSASLPNLLPESFCS